MIIIHPICNVIYIGEHLSIVDSIVIYLCLFFSYFLFALLVFSEINIACFCWNKRIYIWADLKKLHKNYSHNLFNLFENLFMIYYKYAKYYDLMKNRNC